MAATVSEDLDIIAKQEELLRWSAFDAETAWQLGSVMRRMLLETGTGGTIEIELAGQTLFTCTTVGATPGQADWIRRKRNTVRRFARSTYGVGRFLAKNNETMEARHGLELKDYAAHGGGFPLWIKGVGCVGSIIVSGLPQRDDHSLAVAAISEILGIDPPRLV